MIDINQPLSNRLQDTIVREDAEQLKKKDVVKLRQDKRQQQKDIL